LYKQESLANAKVSARQPCWPKTDFDMIEMATQGHSRSFILQSITGRQGVAYRHVMLLALFVTLPKN